MLSGEMSFFKYQPNILKLFSNITILIPCYIDPSNDYINPTLAISRLTRYITRVFLGSNLNTTLYKLKETGTC